MTVPYCPFIWGVAVEVVMSHEIAYLFSGKAESGFSETSADHPLHRLDKRGMIDPAKLGWHGKHLARSVLKYARLSF